MLRPFMRRILAATLLLTPLRLSAIDYDKESGTPAREQELRSGAGKLAAEASEPGAGETGDITFEQILAHPDDPALNYSYARSQVRKGDLKGAAGTLERMLMVDPRLHNIRLFYAVVLFRLDNTVEARRELEALKSADVPAQVRDEAAAYLKKIDERTKRTQVYGSLSAGTEYDWNRNASPEAQKRLFLDTPLELTGDNRRRKDEAALLIGNAGLKRALGPKGRHEAGGSIVYYGSDQEHVKSVNLQAWSFRLNGAYRTRFADVQPELLYDRVSLAGRNFLDNSGAGLLFSRRLNKKTEARLGTKYVYQDYLRTPKVASNMERRGTLYIVSAGAGRVLDPVMKIDADLESSHKSAKKEYDAYDGLALTLRHSWLLGKGMFLLSTVAGERDEYRKADTAISAKKRNDDLLRCGILYGVPVSAFHRRLKKLDSLLLTLNLEYFRSKSTVLNYTYSNNKAALLFTYRWELGI